MPPDLTDWDLLGEYAENRSDEAFGELVRRHANLVHSAALRQMRDPILAEEVTQAVFLALARKARAISRGTIVPGWLVLAVYREAAGMRRAHARRRERERHAADMNSTPNELDTAWERIGPLLDEGLAALGETDRNAVVLHYLERQTYGEIGSALGLSEEAARKRVSRALEALRSFFGTRNVSFPSVTVGSALLAYAVQPAPPALAAAITSAIAAANVSSASFLSELFNRTIEIMAWTKTKTIVVAAVATAAIPIGWQWQENRTLREQVQTLQTTLAQQTAGSASGSLAAKTSEDRDEVAGTGQKSPPDQPPLQQLSTRELMQKALAITVSGKSREEAAKDIEALLAQIPAGELREAADQALTIKESRWRMGFLHMLLRRWVRADGPAAADYFVKSVKGDAQLPLLAGILPIWAEHDPEGAWRWFQNTARNELNFDARGGHNSALKEMFAAMGRNDFERSLVRTRELSGIDASNAFLGLTEGSQTLDQRLRLLAAADAMPDASRRNEVRKTIMSVWAGMQPDEARAYVERLTDASSRSKAAADMGPALIATLDPAKAASWWLEQTTEADRAAALNGIVRRWTDIDLISAADWLAKQGNGPEVDAAKGTFAMESMTRAPEAAMEWASTISDADRRLNHMQSVHRIWRRQDPAKAEAWLAGSKLTVDERRAVTGN